FPRFEKAGLQVELVGVLKKQHKSGRAITDAIGALLKQPPASWDDATKAKLVERLRAFVRMYRPHEARESTVMFAAIGTVATKAGRRAGRRARDRVHRLGRSADRRLAARPRGPRAGVG